MRQETEHFRSVIDCCRPHLLEIISREVGNLCPSNTVVCYTVGVSEAE